HSQWQSGGFEEDVKQQNVHDHRTKESQAQRHKPSEQTQRPAGNLQDRHDVKVVAHEERLHEIAGQTLRRRQRNELQESVQTEHDEGESKQTPGDDAQDFHVCLCFGFWMVFEQEKTEITENYSVSSVTSCSAFNSGRTKGLAPVLSRSVPVRSLR